MFATSLQTETFDHGNLTLIWRRYASSNFNFVDEAALLHNSGRVTDRSQSCLNAIEFALTQACPGLTYDSAPHI